MSIIKSVLEKCNTKLDKDILYLMRRKEDLEKEMSGLQSDMDITNSNLKSLLEERSAILEAISKYE